jgi:hypothetical protein
MIELIQREVKEAYDVELTYQQALRIWNKVDNDIYNEVVRLWKHGKRPVKSYEQRAAKWIKKNIEEARSTNSLR